jgi:hypothetical protein
MHPISISEKVFSRPDISTITDLKKTRIGIRRGKKLIDI